VADLCQVLVEIGIDVYDRLPIWHVAGPPCMNRYMFAKTITQAPGSSKVLFHRDDIRDFRDEHKFPKKGGGKKRTEVKVVKPSISSVKKTWEI